ncbi:MAG: ArsR family transcriptional regulator [Pseudohongiellaceae bacterium]|jgi:ArsR family transcriptional regulator
MTPLSFYKCLADDTRLKILLLVAVKKELCVCELTTALALSQPKISRHLAQLRKCQLLTDERRGRWVYYQLDSQLPGWAHQVLQLTATSAQSDLAVALNNLTRSGELC